MAKTSCTKTKHNECHQISRKSNLQCAVVRAALPMDARLFHAHNERTALRLNRLDMARDCGASLNGRAVGELIPALCDMTMDPYHW